MCVGSACLRRLFEATRACRDQRCRSPPIVLSDYIPANLQLGLPAPPAGLSKPPSLPRPGGPPVLAPPRPGLFYGDAGSHGLNRHP